MIIQILWKNLEEGDVQISSLVNVLNYISMFWLQ